MLADAGCGQETDRAAPVVVRLAADEVDPDPLRPSRRHIPELRLEGDVGKLTIKGKVQGISRSEYEYPIPQQDAAEMLDNLCLRPLIEKTRYRIEFAGLVWEVDEFYGVNEGLILAEVELESEDAEFARPDWVGQEVSGNPRYYNANLVKDPYTEW